MKKITFMVCPHDTAKNPDRWFMFAQFLTKNINSSVKFEQSLDFVDFHKEITSGGLIYSNPQDSLKLIKNHGYIPIARPINLFDEIVFITSHKIKKPTLQDFSENTVVSVTDMMVTQVGINYLQKEKIIPSEVLSKPSWMAVIKSMTRNEYNFALVYKDFYDGLTNLSKSGVQKVGETQEEIIHHNFLIAPELQAMTEAIQSCLLTMQKNNSQGEKILNSLGMEKLVAVNKTDILHPWNSTKNTIKVIAKKLAKAPTLDPYNQPINNSEELRTVKIKSLDENTSYRIK
ncbi:MAG TPA: hypothetical protein EYG68_05025 [Leucothrix mucor]|nr:hypothetical protein [Leucothrix mucor]